MKKPITRALLTSQEAADYLSVSPRTLLRLEERGLITSSKLLRTRRYLVEALDRMIEASMTQIR